MPVSVIASISSLGVSIGSALGLTVAQGSFAAFAIGFLGQTAIAAALNALAPKPKISNLNRGYQINTRGSALDHQVIYGEARVGGVIVFEESVEGQIDDPDIDNQFLLRVYAHTGHEIEGYEEVYIDGKKVTEWRNAATDAVVSKPSAVPNGTPLIPYTTCEVNIDGSVNAGACNNLFAFASNGDGRRINYLVLRFYDGSQTTADASLIADSNGQWTTSHVLRDTAYMTATMGYDAKIFPNGVPEITCTIKGKKVFDPRTSTTAWSDNPALCIRDYLTSDYGVGTSASNIDDTLFQTAANVCDQTTTVDSVTRYTCNGAFLTSATPFDMLNDLLTSMGGLLWYAQGKWRIKPAYWTAPTLTLNEDDLRSNIGVKTRHTRRENFNIVRGTFRGPETGWQVTDYPEVTNSGFVTEDGGQDSVLDFDLPFTDNSLEARRLALILLERNRKQITVSATFGLRAFSAQVGDVISLTVDRFGWEEKTFEVTSWSFNIEQAGELLVDLTLRETSEAVFDEINDGVSLNLDNTNLADPFTTTTPTNLVAVPSGFISAGGSFVNTFSVSWTADDALAANYSVEWKEQSATVYNSVTVSTRQYEIPSVKVGSTYDIRVRSTNKFGVASPYASITAVGGGDDVAPKPPTTVTAVGKVKEVSLIWIAPSQDVNNDPLIDLLGYNIYRSLFNDFGTSTFVGNTSSNSYQDINLADQTLYYYWVTAIDTSGNESTPAASGPVQTNFISAADMVADIREEIGAARIDVVATLPNPTLGNYSPGDFVFLTTDKKLYELDSSLAWNPVVGEILPNSITETEITDGSISTPKLATNAVTADKIEANAVTSDKILANSIITGKIAAGAVSADKMAVTTLAAISANLGVVTAGSIDTVVSGVGLRVNTSGLPNAVYAYQDNNTIYAIFAENTATGGGTIAADSLGGFTGEFRNALDGNNGIWGDFVAINGVHSDTGGGQGQVGVCATGGGYAFNALSGGYYDTSGSGYLPFTGKHEGILLKSTQFEFGDIMVDGDLIAKNLSDVITELLVSDQPQMSNAVGVISKVYDKWTTPAAFVDQEETKKKREKRLKDKKKGLGNTVNKVNIDQYDKQYDLVAINSVGEGCINVCGRGGDIQAGDLITTSSLRGKGEKQSDDLIRNYTVAKARESVTFNNPDEVKQIACIYLCG